METKMKVARWWAVVRVICAAGLMTMVSAVGWAQIQSQTSKTGSSGVPADSSGTPQGSAEMEILRSLKEQMTALQSTIRELRDETNRYRAETQELRAELKAALAGTTPGTTPPYFANNGRDKGGPPSANDAVEQASGTTPPYRSNSGSDKGGATTDAGDRLAKLQEQYDLLSGKVDEQYQTKVESASKYRVRLSGIALLNLFENHGAVDNQDVPAIALSSDGRAGGSFGGSLRQSQIGLEVYGPEWHGARIKSNLQFDFAGGFPETENGATMGLVRLRTAVLRLDWARTSIVGGQDAPFFSPLSPTSLASLAQPALAYSGNLWNWIPQLRVEHHIAMQGGSKFTVQAGILDPLTGELPVYQFYRVPQAGEASRQPAYASRVAWTSASEQRAVSFGAGAYYSRQNWGAGRMVNGWAATADAYIPISRVFSITGEFYRGRAIGGLGGGLGASVVFYGPAASASTRIEGLDAAGGWAQLKMRATPKLEFNIAAGQDNPSADQFRDASLAGAAYYGGTVRNRSLLSNVIYHPRSDLLLSMEYRRIESYKLVTPTRSADQINLVMGVLF